MKLEALLDIKLLNVAGQEYDSTLQEDLEINPTNLVDAFAGHGRLMAIYGFAYEQALSHAAKLKIELERTYALCDERARANASVHGKVTEKMVENMVITSPEYQAKQAEVLQANEDLGVLRSMRDAIKDRKDMLVSIGAQERALMNSDLTMRS